MDVHSTRSIVTAFQKKSRLSHGAKNAVARIPANTTGLHGNMQMHMIDDIIAIIQTMFLIESS